MSDTVALLDRAIIAYYGFSDPIMSDEEFDALFLATYGPDVEPLARYREIFSEASRRRNLSVPMLSLAKARSSADLTPWLNKATAAGADSVWIVPKFDGLAVLITTDDDGKVTTATMRGDGAVGQDVTHMVSLIPDAANLGANKTVRAEVCLPPSAMVEASKVGGREYTHARNAASGILHATGPDALASADLLVLRGHFDFEHDSLGPFPIKELTGDKLATELGHYRDETLSEVDVLTDGAVMVATKDGEPLTVMGDNGYTPHWALAWKYPDDAREAVIGDVIWQAGRTKTTPVAVFTEPIDFDGVSTTRATLHNIDFIRGLDIHIGDTVSVIRSGQVIPYITSLVSPGENRVEVIEPEHASEGTAEYAAALSAHMAKVLDVYGAGPSVTTAISEWATARYPDAPVREALITSLLDLRDVKMASQVLTGDKRPAKLSAELTRATAEADEATWLALLGYRGIGRRMSRKLVGKAGSVKALLAALDAPESLCGDGVGVKVLSPLTDDLTELRRLFADVIPATTVATTEEATEEATVIVGKVVLTGALDIPRKQMCVTLAEVGYELASSVTSETVAVITPDASKGSSKLIKAAKLGIPVIEVPTVAEAVSRLAALD